jgi:hypothetical protein
VGRIFCVPSRDQSRPCSTNDCRSCVDSAQSRLSSISAGKMNNSTATDNHVAAQYCTLSRTKRECRVVRTQVRLRESDQPQVKVRHVRILRCRRRETEILEGRGVKTLGLVYISASGVPSSDGQENKLLKLFTLDQTYLCRRWLTEAERSGAVTVASLLLSESET